MGIWSFAKFLRNARTLACVGNRLSSPKVRHCHYRACHPLALMLLVGPDDASSRLHSKEQPFTCPRTSYMPAVSRYFGFVCRRLGTGVGAAIGVSLSLRLC